nr:phosphodiester glycosidase family protein [Paenibacillus athensensis]
MTMYGMLSCTLAVIAGLCWFFLTSSGASVRYMMADTLITTQHRSWAAYLIGNAELQKRVEAYWKRFDDMGKEPDKGLVQLQPEPELASGPQEPITVEPISGINYAGYLVTIADPKSLRVVVPNKVGKGEKVTSMVKRTGALLGINGGGFVDPEWKGNGFQPEGIVMSGGRIFYNDGDMNTLQHVVGIDRDGRMIAGNFKASELLKMGVQEAVSFSPRFIVNGVGLIKNQSEGWGVAPRTCMAQTKDGAILFAIIDGRQKHSIGATLYDVQEIFLKHGAVTAANLDGGSSTVLVRNNEIVNKPSSEYGERYLPTAWLAFDDPAGVKITNIWQGLDIRQIDPSKW